jgi:predicted dehydrogenase
MVLIGIVGSGYIAETHAKSLEKITDADLKAVAGGSRAKSFAEKYNVVFFNSVEEMLISDTINSVIITSPHGAHKEQAIMAANNNKNVYLEKPMATNVEDCQQIIDACNKNNVTLMVGQSQRYFHTNALVKKILNSEELGKPLIVRSSQLGAGLDLRELPFNHWAFDKKMGGSGSTLGYGVHNIDKVLWWLNDIPSKIYGSFRSDWIDQNKDTSSFIQLSTTKGTDVQIWNQLSFGGKMFDYQRDCAEIICEKGNIECQTYRRVRVCKENKDWETVYEMNFREHRAEIFGLPINEFVDSIVQKRLPAIRGIDGLNAVKVVELAYKSSNNDEVVVWNQN